MRGVKGRVALVTGAGSAEGIGFACARLLAEGGARVAITSTTARIEQRLKELGLAEADKGALIADLTKTDEVEKLVKDVLRRFGRIDIVINNAGMVQVGKKTKASRVEKITDEEWQRHLDLNLKTCFALTRAALPFMQRRRYGRIVNISSVTGPMVTNPRSSGYSAAKAAMTGLTRLVAIENARKGITCNAVLPGWIVTASSTPHEIIAGRATPAGRPGRAEEVAAAALFLASEEASYVTGTTIVVDGGNAIAEYKGAPDGWY
jgi:3-oxoacyl-[acyl-carrier protein] reductase